ncbi:MAG: alanine:cation symporter family protein, partial [Paramuribaculum sp.]|nr:alanine:cation symporter family protein [Paramuribaculum sp.]
VMVGALVSLDLVWALADVTMALMTLCNVAAILVLGRYALACLADYAVQRRQGIDPVYRRSTIPRIARMTDCWPL